MAPTSPPTECPADQLTQALEAIKHDDSRGLAILDDLLRTYDGDPRLHFLRGSLLASEQRYGEAHQAMRRAVEIAPGFAIARFQLGLLELTSGDAQTASTTWRPLLGLEPTNALRTFVVGLTHMARDEFQPAIEALREGIRQNHENPILNKDMLMVIDTIQSHLAKPAEEQEISSTHLLLQQYTTKSTKH